jgi:hypothetical protein
MRSYTQIGGKGYEIEMMNQEYLEKYCIEQINKCKQVFEHKTHLRYRGRLEAFNEVLEIIKNKKEIDYEKRFNK